MNPQSKRIRKLHELYKNKPAAQTAGQTLPDATPPVGKIHQFSKIAVTFEPIQPFTCTSRFRISKKKMLINLVLWLEAPFLTVWAWQRRKDISTKGWMNEWISQSVTKVFVEQPLASPGSANYGNVKWPAHGWFWASSGVSSGGCVTNNSSIKKSFFL